MNDDLLKRARQIHRTDSREIIEELVAALESDRAKLAEAKQTIADFEDFLQQELTMRAAGRQGVLLMEAPLLCPNPNCGWDLIRKRPMNPKSASGEWEVKK